MQSINWKFFILGVGMAFMSTNEVYALTDEEALASGMSPIEVYMMAEMDATLSPDLNREGVARAVQSHRLVIAVNKASMGRGAQTLTMYENGVEILREKISTGRERQETAKSGRVYFSNTPKGFFRPTKMYQDYLSYAWNAPMPNAVFFVGGIALHATTKSHYAELGTRASGGCVRLVHETSQFLRQKIMDTGKGRWPWQFKLSKEAEGRNRILNNSIVVDEIDRQQGVLLNEKIKSWDTVIIVYEE
jgi:hypothetical protein